MNHQVNGHEQSWQPDATGCRRCGLHYKWFTITPCRGFPADGCDVPKPTYDELQRDLESTTHERDTWLGEFQREERLAKFWRRRCLLAFVLLLSMALTRILGW